MSIAFARIDVAEEEIKRAGGAPGTRLWRMFKHLMPGRLASFGLELYRGHARELLSRAKNGEDLRPGTDAECCVLFHDASLLAPLSASYTSAYEDAFARCMNGARPVPLKGGGRYSYPGEENEIIAEVRKKCAVESRVLESAKGRRK